MNAQLKETSQEKIEEKWDRIKKVITEVAENILGQQTSSNKREWFHDNCKKAVKERIQAHRPNLSKLT